MVLRIENNFKNLIFKNKSRFTIIFTLFIMAIFFPPKLFENLPIYRYIRLTQTGLSILSVLLLLRVRKINKFIILTFIYFALFFISTFLGGKGYEMYIAHATSTIGVVVLLFYLFRLSKSSFIKSIKYYSLYILFLHAILILLYRDGVIVTEVGQGISKGIHIFGESNQSTIIVIMCYLSIILTKDITSKGDNLLIFLSTILVVFSIFLISSSNGKIGLVCLFLGFVAIELLDILKIDIFRKNKENWAIGLVIAFLVVNILMTVVKVQNLFSPIIEILFKKDATLSSRTLIWDEAKNLIKSNPILGYGAIEGRYIYILEYRHYYDAHNFFLETLLRGGGLLLLSYSSLLYISIKTSLNNYFRDMKYKSVLFIMVLIIMSLSEVYTLNVVFFILYIPYLLSLRKDNK